MPQARDVEQSPLLATSLRAASILLPIVLFPGAAVAQEEVTCPGIPGKVVILKNQPYALCALATSFIYNEITYAKCDRLQGDSISLPQRFPFPPRPGVTSSARLVRLPKRRARMVTWLSIRVKVALTRSAMAAFVSPAPVATAKVVAR